MQHTGSNHSTNTKATGRTSVIHKIAVPDQKLTTEFSRLVQPLLKQTWMKESETRTLSTLRDTLLPKLISGELRMKDAERFTGRTT